MKLTERSYTFVDNPIQARYSISGKNETSKKLVFVYPDNLDSINWDENPLVKVLAKKDYRIVIPQIAGKNELQKIAFDSRSNRIASSILIYNQLLSLGEADSSSEILLLGIGEGAYIIPQLANTIPQVKHFIMINSVGSSFLGELQLLVSEGNPDFIKSRKMRYFGMDNVDELKTAIEGVLSKQGNARSLGNRTNGDWYSYYEHNLETDLSLATPNGTYILSEKYPFASNTSRAQLGVLIKNNPLLNIKVHSIEGKGNFNNEKELLILAQKVQELIN